MVHSLLENNGDKYCFFKHCKVGHLPVINGVITPINGLINHRYTIGFFSPYRSYDSPHL